MASSFVEYRAKRQREAAAARQKQMEEQQTRDAALSDLKNKSESNATRKNTATTTSNTALDAMKQRRTGTTLGNLDYNDSFVLETSPTSQKNQMTRRQALESAPKSAIQTQIDEANQPNKALPKNITIAPNMTQNTTLGATRSEKPVYTGTPQDALDAYKKTLADRKAQSRLAANQAQAEKHPLQGAVLSAASNAINTAITPIKVATDKLTGNKSYDYSRFANDAEAYRQGAVSGTQQALNVKPDSMAGKVASGAVSIGINLASSLPIFGAVASGISSIPALASMSPTVSNIISTSGAMGLTTAADEAGAYADSDTTGSRYLQDILVNSAAGAAGSLASSGITAAGAKLLKNKGLSYNRLARSIVAGLSSSAYAGADTGTKQLARELGYDDGQKVTREQLVQDLLTGFAFGVVNDLLRGSAYNDSQAVGGEQIEENYFKGVSDADLKSAYRKMAKAMHPDNGGDAAAFAQMSKEYYWRLANAAAGAYKRGAQATASNRTDEAAQANSEFKDGVRELLTVLKEQPTNENVQAAVEILTNVSDQPTVNDTSTTQGEAQSVVDAALDKIKKEKNGRKTADQDVITLTDTQEPQPDIADESRQAVENTIQNVADEHSNEITATESTPEEAKASTQAAVEAMKAQNDVSDDINAEIPAEPTTATTPTEVTPTLDKNLVTNEESFKSPSGTDTYTAPDTSMSAVEPSPDSPSVNLPTIEDRAKQYTGKARELYENGFDGNDILTYDENMAKVYDAASHGETLNALMVNEPGFYDFLNKYGDTILPFYDAVYENTTRMKNSLGGNNNDEVRKELTVRDGGAVQQPVEVRNGTSGGHDRVRAEENESNEGRGQSVSTPEENRGSDAGSVSEPSGHGVSGLRGAGSSERDQVQSDGFGSGRELSNTEERYTIKHIGGNSYVWDNKLDKSVSSAYASSFDDERIASVLTAIRSTKDMNRYSVKEVGNHEYYVWDNETDTAVSKKYPAMNLAKYMLDKMRIDEFEKSKSDSDSNAESKRFTVSEFDKESGTYSVWDNEKDRAFSKYKTKAGADKAAERLNMKEAEKSAADRAPKEQETTVKKQNVEKPATNTEAAKPKKQEKAAPKQAVTEKEQADQKVAIATQPEPKGANYVLTPEAASEIPTTESKRVSANIDAIRTIKDILTGDRLATKEEQLILAKYTGWGGISDSKWNEVEGELSGILTKEELESARSSKTDAFYTDPSVIRGIYTGLENIGFHGGRILEPSAGVGRFVGTLPQNLIPGSRWTAVELDPITGNIAKALYPNSDVRVQGFETVKIPKGFMDTVVGNVPFGSYGVSDKSYPDYITSKIHNYFIAKSLDALRPGGIACLVTSSGTLNSHDEKARAYFAKKADLIGAIRLPNSAFKVTGTSVVSDVLVFQKRADGTPYKGEAFEKMGWLANGDYTNEYFVNHPDMVLGTRRATTGQFGRGVITYDEDTSKGSLEKQIAKAFWNIDRKMEYPEVSHRQAAVESLKQARNNKVGTAYKKDGKIYLNNGGNESKIELEAKQAAIYSDAIDIRDTARELIEAMQLGKPEDEVKTVRDRLNRQYDAFKGKNKNGFHSPSVKAVLKNDTDYAFLQALEKVDKKEVKKADIFTKNTINPVVDITHVDTVADGVEVSIGQVGYIDPGRIATLTGKTVDAVKAELESGDFAYKDGNGNYISAETYLSGNVRAKLKEAQFLAEGDKSYQRNVTALKKVVPKDIKGSEIDVNIGVTWIPPQVYAEFAEHLMNAPTGSIKVSYSPANGYTMSFDEWRFKNRAENNSIWGTKHMPFLFSSSKSKGLFISILNNNELKVTAKDLDGKTIIDRNATEALQAMKDKINAEFNNWLWKDGERTAELEKVYNDSFNGMVRPHYRSEVSIAGQTADISLRKHQGSAINRIVQSPYNTLLQHGAGAGKTFAMIGATMKLKQLGIAKKPVLVVPKNKVSDWAGDFFKMFPNAKVLLADSTTFAKANRKEFTNRIATMDFDAVIISHDQFKNIPMSKEYQERFYKNQLDSIMAQITETQAKEGRKATTYQIESRKKAIEKKLKDIGDMKQDVDNINFENTGIDYVFVDEAQKFKNLAYTTNLKNVADMGNPTGSSRAYDMKMKMDYVRSIQKGKGIVFGTATPVMNSPVEAYTMMQYLVPEELEKRGITNLDNFIDMFGRVEGVTRQNAAGTGWEIRNTFSGFKNMPEWQQLWGMFTDRVKTEDVPGIKLPKMKGGDREVVVCQAGDYARKVISGLGDRLKARTTKGENHIFKIQDDGKKASFSQRMLDPSLPYGPKEKVPVACDEIYKIWEESKTFTDVNGNTQENGVQLVFCDKGVPSKTKPQKATDSETDSEAGDDVNPNTEDYVDGLNVYQDMKDILVAKGIPADQIAFIHDVKNENQTEALYQKIRNGEVRVLIGSSMKMGEGLNVQDRVVALHEMNPLMRPGDVEQVEARAIRQGNLSPEVAIKVYVTEDTFDTKQWDTLRVKARYIDEITSGTFTGRNADYSSDEFGASAGDIMAVSSGNPKLKEQAEINDKLRRLEGLASEHKRTVYNAGESLRDAERTLAKTKEALPKYEADAKLVQDLTGNRFAAKVGKSTFDSRKEFGAAIIKAANKAIEMSDTPKKIGVISGFDIIAGSNGSVSLRGQADYVTQINFQSDIGTATSIVNALKKPEGMAKAAKETIALNESNIPKFKEQMESTFDKQVELDEVRAQARQIEQELLNDGKVAINETPETYSRRVGDAETIHKKRVASVNPSNSSRPQDWTASKNKDSNATVKPIADIIGQAMHDFGINLDTGYVRGAGVTGQFNTKDKGLRTKIANDLPSVAHEFGHWIDDRYTILKDDAIPKAAEDDFKKAFEADPGNKKAYDPSLYKIEGVAEFIRYYLQNKDTAAIDYPAATDYIKKKISNPKDLARFEQFADDINAYYSAGATSAAGSMVYKENRLADYRTRKEKRQDAIDKAYQKAVDSNHGIRLYDRKTGGDAYVYAANAAYSDARARQLIDGDILDIEGNYVAPGLKDALRGINTVNKEEYTAFNEYLTVRHGQEWVRSGKRVFADDRMNNVAWMGNRAAELERQYPQFKEAAEHLYMFINNFTWTYGVQTGLISADRYKAMKAAYHDYVPFFRAGFKTCGNSLAKAKGSGRQIIMPVDNVVDMVNKMVATATRNRTLQEIRKAALDFGPDATLLERIPDPKIPKKIDIRSLKQEIYTSADGKAMSSDALDVLDDVLQTIDDTYTQFETGKANLNKGEICILVDGKPEFWKVNDELLLDSISNMSPKHLEGVLGAYGKITRFMTANITGNNVIWSVFSNAPRDLQTMFNYSKDTKNPAKIVAGLASTYLNSFKEATGKEVSPLYREYLAMGGGSAGVWQGSDKYAADVRKSLNTTGLNKKGRKSHAFNPFSAIMWLSDTIEQGPRFATYSFCRKEGLTPQEAFREAMDITVDFRRHGTDSKAANAVIPFFNAGIQSTDKTLRYFSGEDLKGKNYTAKQRGKIVFQRWAFLAVTSLITATLQYALNHKSDEDEKNYSQLSNHVKNSNFLIPLGDGKYFAITKSHEVGIPSSAFERTLEYTKANQDHAFDGFAAYATSNLLPSVVSDVAELPFNAASEGLHSAGKDALTGALSSAGIFGVMAAINANKDYLGSPIVSGSLEDKVPKQQYTSKTSQVAYLMGKYLNLSPQQIDYFGKNVLGGVWQYQTALFPINDRKGTAGKRDVTLGVKNTYFKDNLYSQDLTNWLYDKADKSSMNAGSYPNDKTYQLESAMDSSVTSYYSKAMGLANDNPDSSNYRIAKQSLLDTIKTYQKKSDNGSWTAAEKFVQSVAKASDSPNTYLPGAMQTSIKTQDEEEHDLTAREYIQYQKKYEELFYKFITDQKSGAKTQEEKEELISQAKNTAKEQAQSFILDKKGVKGDVKSTGWSSYRSAAREEAKTNDPEATLSQTDIYNLAVDYAKKYGSNAKDTFYSGLSDKQKAKYDAWESLGGTFDNYDEYLESKEFDSIKDNDGNSISGSKKYQVAEYLANQVKSGNMSYPLAEAAWEDAGYNKKGTDSLDSYYGSSDYNKVGNKIGK